MEDSNGLQFTARGSSDSGKSLISHSLSIEETRREPSGHCFSRFGCYLVIAIALLCACGLVAVMLLRIDRAEDLARENSELIALLQSRFDSAPTTRELKNSGNRDARLGAPQPASMFMPPSLRSTLFPKTEGTRRQISRKDAQQNVSYFKQSFGNGNEFIHVVGRGNAQCHTRAREPFHHWKVAERTGTILLRAGTHIHVSVTGLYFVYSQVQFLMDNALTRHISSVVYCVKKNRQDLLIRSVVPVRNCNATCTVYHARLVKLNRNDQVSVEVLQDVQIVTRAPATFFGAFLVMPLK